MSNKVKVLHIGLDAARGGIESFLMSLQQNISADGIIFDYVSYVPHPAFESELKSFDSKIYAIGDRSRVGSYWRSLREIYSNQYDFVHIHKNSALDPVPFLCAKFSGVPRIVAHSHNTDPGFGTAKKIVHGVGTQIINHVSTDFFACSQMAADWLFGSKSRESKIIWNGVDTARFKFDAIERHQLRRRLGLEDAVLVGCVGRLVEQKNHKFLLELFAKMAVLDPRAHLLLLGAGPLKNELVAIAESMGMESRITFLGAVDNVGAYLSAMDLLVMPSLYEGLPIAAIEAQMAGLPVVMSDSITSEAVINENVVRLPLSMSATEWAHCCVCAAHDSRIVMTEEKLRRYDAAATAADLKDFYLGKRWASGKAGSGK